MTSSGLRDLSASELKLRALEDSGVKADELNVAIAHEMWQRADNEGLETEIRRLLAPQLRQVVEEANAASTLLAESGGSPSGQSTPRAGVGIGTMPDGDVSEIDFGSSLEPFCDPNIRMEWFFFRQDRSDDKGPAIRLGHDYVPDPLRAACQGQLKS
jgi:hypothetical protein